MTALKVIALALYVIAVVAIATWLFLKGSDDDDDDSSYGV